jgi:perosamine synthetase
MKNLLKFKIKKFIPVSEPCITKADLKEINKAAKSGWISSAGVYISKFEKNFSKYIGVKYSTTVSSGTAALEIALKSLNIKRGDEVIIPNFTIISNALAVIKLGAQPVFIDCKINDWNLDYEKIKKKITKKTKAIIATHIYNFPCEILKIKKLCKDKKIYLIEDAAEVLGLQIKKKKCGSFGDISIFSFYANKQITTGEGGMICSNNYRLIKKCMDLKNLCFGKKNRFNHTDLGWNYRLTNLQASLGCSQLKRINNIVKRKREIGKRYYKNLRNNKNIFITPPLNKYGWKNIYWVVGILIKNKKISSYNLSKTLKLLNIETRPFFYPMHKQQIFKKLNYKFCKDNYPNSEYISKYGIYLPSGLKIKNHTIDKISKILNEILN